VTAYRAVDRRQAHADALALGLGCKKGLEDVPLHLDVHAGAAVGDTDPDGRAATFAAIGVEHLTRGRGHHVVHVDGRDTQLAALGHGVAGVGDEVQEGVVQQARIAGHLRLAGRQIELQLDIGGEAEPQLGDHLVDDLVQVHLDGAVHALASVGEQLRGQFPATPYGDQDMFDEFRQGGVLAQRLAQKFPIAHDAGQLIVVVVGHAAGELAHRLEFFRLAQAIFHLLARGYVAHHCQDAVLATDLGRA